MATTQQKNLASVWELIRSAHTAMIVGGAVAFIGAGLKVVPYIALVEIGRGFLTGASAAHQWGWFTAAVVAMVIHGVAYTGALGATHLAEANLRNELRLKLVNKLPRLPLGWFNDRSSGQINRAVISDTEQIHTLVAHLAGDMMNSAGTIVVGFGYLLWLDARFAGLLILAWLLVMGLSMLPGMMGMRQSFDEYSAAQQELSTVTVEMVDGIKEVKNFGMTADVFGRFDAAARKSADVTMNWMRKSGISVAIMGAVMQPAATLALTIGLGFWFVQLGWVTPITVVAFALVWVGIPEGLTALVQIFQHIYAAKQAANSTLEVLKTPELPVPTAPASLTADPSLIEIDGVTFGYEPDNPVIKNVTLTCRPGTVTALVGPSGGGKSTLAKLIARFWDVGSGVIRIGGIDIREQTDKQLMGSMALVFQDAMIATDTIARNIALGKPDATHEEIIEAARKAHIHDRIMALPHGYDTVLGAGDGFLSGGEEQRLSIARAFLSAPQILILDEATAQADAHSELEIQRAISGLAEGRTVVMIAHRLSTIQSADQIAVIDEGRITECGPHNELIARGGQYARLWAAQQNTMTGSHQVAGGQDA
ncbi:MAG: ABC transporter ATP-binding protein [Propionibacteriaceae bacterium]|nr:ABC transporter ATP-binding protein [Propionibacteriaceae bacterium]